ncbi:hypothetical protein AJ88_48990 [Mesorhizobium amorphae CCBAU 01583]|nr:hypothetical protein AJ88_48990 [Mesorhizobium amorphae CCBAU 01583]
MFYERCETEPSEISRKLKSINPSPYSFFINLGEGEYLIGASPEMFVRVNGRRVEPARSPAPSNAATTPFPTRSRS